MPIKSVDEIIYLSDSHKAPNKIAYKHLIKQLDSQIVEKASEGFRSVSFQIPGFIWAIPIYDRDSVCKKIAKHYKKIGFVCTTSNYEMFLTWEKKSEDSEPVESSDEESVTGKTVFGNDDEGSECSDDINETKQVVFTQSGPSLAQQLHYMRNNTNIQ